MLTAAQLKSKTLELPAQEKIKTAVVGMASATAALGWMNWEFYQTESLILCLLSLEPFSAHFFVHTLDTS